MMMNSSSEHAAASRGVAQNAREKLKLLPLLIMVCWICLGATLFLFAWLFWLGYRQQPLLTSIDLILAYVLPFAGATTFFVLALLLCRRWVTAESVVIGSLFLVCGPLLVIQCGFVASVGNPWLQGFCYRARTQFDFERAREWAQDQIDDFADGKLRIEGRRTYYSIAQYEWAREDVPNFLISPWRFRPVVGILEPGIYVAKPCVCLSWYGYHLVLGDPNECILAGPAPIARPYRQTFILYDPQK